VPTHPQPTNLRLPVEEVCEMAALSDGGLLTGDVKGRLLLFGPTLWECIPLSPPHKGAVTALCDLPGGRAASTTSGSLPRG
jgi:hypothetical protein